MCVACIEYTKDKLNLGEFRSAMREMGMEDQRHAAEVERLLKEYADKPDELKKHLEKLNYKFNG